MTTSSQKRATREQLQRQLAQIRAKRSVQQPAPASTSKNVVSTFVDDLKSTLFKYANKGASQIESGLPSSPFGALQAGANLAGTVAGGAADLVFGTPLRTVFHSLPQRAQESIKGGVGATANALGVPKVVGAYEDFKTKNPRIAQNVENVANIAALIPGARVAGEALSTAGKKTFTTLGDVGKRAGSLADDALARTRIILRGEKPKNVTQLIEKTGEALEQQKISTSAARGATEVATSKQSLLDRWRGIRTDIKNRIAGKPEKLKEYFDVAHARNNFDTLPTPLEFGAKRVQDAVSKMETILQETGSKIGSFRKKVGSYVANPDQIARIEKTFVDQLDKLNFRVVNGKIVQKAGTLSRLGSSGDAKVLQELFDQMQIAKQGGNLERLIDLRNVFDRRINFGKSAREVSNSVDPVARSVRKEIASVGEEIVGKSEAYNLSRYSDFIDALENLRSYTDRRAGAEFLLKQALSERGGMPRELMRIIKEETNIDLMDDAVMAQLATELIGNAAQKGVFRQEVMKAGLDAAALLKGSPMGAIMTTLGKVRDIGLEKAYIDVAKKGFRQ
jgi:hypothetical protein